MDDEHWLYSRTSTTTPTNSTDSSAFSSTEAESYRAKRRSRKLADQGTRSSDESQKTKRTSVLDNARLISKSYGVKNLKAVKLLEELKRPKQPVSPGARLTSFLNSIFQSNAKKVKLCSVSKTTEVKSTSSRSCFSRTRYTTDNNNCNNLKRSVRDYPVRGAVDGDSRDSIYNNITRKKRPIPEFTGKKSVGIKANIHHNELTCITRKISFKNSITSCRDEDEEEEDDVWSYSSSDLFELDSHRIGITTRNRSVSDDYFRQRMVGNTFF
ncbi:unnamed protein product [Arabis nemorensis]|uniref:Protein BIG GRAIN 1-like B n=1 Tax=Arabis nemorensis TaxID=586526 RepID=A0A565ASY0_9BRAS|nr:unnamed protein product [Arabis nemorensis]